MRGLATTVFPACVVAGSRPHHLTMRPSPQKDRLRALQGAVMTVEKTLGASLKEIASTWGVSTGYVNSRLEEVSNAGFAQAFERALLERMVPQALAVYEAALGAGDLDAARDLLFGLGILRKDGKPLAGAAKPEDLVQSLDDYKARKAAQDAPKGLVQ